MCSIISTRARPSLRDHLLSLVTRHNPGGRGRFGRYAHGRQFRQQNPAPRHLAQPPWHPDQPRAPRHVLREPGHAAHDGQWAAGDRVREARDAEPPGDQQRPPGHLEHPGASLPPSFSRYLPSSLVKYTYFMRQVSRDSFVGRIKDPSFHSFMAARTGF